MLKKKLLLLPIEGSANFSISSYEATTLIHPAKKPFPAKTDVARNARNGAPIKFLLVSNHSHNSAFYIRYYQVQKLGMKEHLI